MLDGLRNFLLGKPVPPSGVDGIPHETREAHHRLHNTAMRIKQTARLIDREANDLLETLARDIKRGRGEEC